VSSKVRYFRRRRLSAEEGKQYAQRVLLTPIPERLERAAELHLDDPEMLMALLGALPLKWETAPEEALAEASFLYDHLEKLQVRFPADPILYDEREYFLGEAARIAGTACRFLSRRDEARFWLDLAEAWFLATENSASNLARVTYQRLALRFEEREFDAVLKLLPHLIANLERLAMPEDALKSRLLRATVLKEVGRLEEAAQAYGLCIEQAKALRNEVLLAAVYVNLVQLYGFLGVAEKAMSCAQEATPVLRRSRHHVALAKLQWGLGHLLRNTGKLAASIEAFRESQRSFAAVSMRADVAAVHLILADLLLEAGQASQAEWEIRQALPVIDEYKLVPEGIAALSLLRESVKRRQIDRRALRELHGYFQEVDSLESFPGG
jgi:tetratricopeptide (TPR) repeat protein